MSELLRDEVRALRRELAEARGLTDYWESEYHKLQHNTERQLAEEQALREHLESWRDAQGWRHDLTNPEAEVQPIIDRLITAEAGVAALEAVRKAAVLAYRWLYDAIDPHAQFEDIGEWYCKETGWLRPGKDEARSGFDAAERETKFMGWCHMTGVLVRAGLGDALKRLAALDTEREHSGGAEGTEGEKFPNGKEGSDAE